MLPSAWTANLKNDLALRVGTCAQWGAATRYTFKVCQVHVGAKGGRWTIDGPAKVGGGGSGDLLDLQTLTEVGLIETGTCTPFR